MSFKPLAEQTFNDFFTRQLKPNARPVDSRSDPNVICSAADCRSVGISLYASGHLGIQLSVNIKRLTVWNTLDAAKQFWIKSRQFTLKSLFDDDTISSLPEFRDGAAVAIFRLAPADFHRWRSPVGGVMGSIKKIPGQYFTVRCKRKSTT